MLINTKSFIDRVEKSSYGSITLAISLLLGGNCKDIKRNLIKIKIKSKGFNNNIFSKSSQYIDVASSYFIGRYILQLLTSIDIVLRVLRVHPRVTMLIDTKSFVERVEKSSYGSTALEVSLSLAGNLLTLSSAFPCDRRQPVPI